MEGTAVDCCLIVTDDVKVDNLRLSEIRSFTPKRAFKAEFAMSGM